MIGRRTSAEVARYDLRSTAPAAAAAARRRARRRRRRAPARDRLRVLERHERHAVVLRPGRRRRQRGDRREVRVHRRPAGAELVGSAELRRARARTRACACDRGEGGGTLLAWLDRCAQGRKRVREKHAHVRASPGVRRGRRQLGRARRVVEVGRAVFDAVTLAIAAVLFPLLARRAALGARGVVARVRTLEALPACRPAAVALELPRCNPPRVCVRTAANRAGEENDGRTYSGRSCKQPLSSSLVAAGTLAGGRRGQRSVSRSNA